MEWYHQNLCKTNVCGIKCVAYNVAGELLGLWKLGDGGIPLNKIDTIKKRIISVTSSINNWTFISSGFIITIRDMQKRTFSSIFIMDLSKYLIHFKGENRPNSVKIVQNMAIMLDIRPSNPKIWWVFFRYGNICLCNAWVHTHTLFEQRKVY